MPHAGYKTRESSLARNAISKPKMKQQIMYIAVTAFLGLETISAAALPAAPTEVVHTIWPTPWPEAFDGEWRERMKTLPKRDEPANTAPPSAWLRFLDELGAVFNKYEDVAGLNETTSAEPQADEKRLQARHIFEPFVNDLKHLADDVSQRFMDIATATIGGELITAAH